MSRLTQVDAGSRTVAKNWIKKATEGGKGVFRKKAEAAGKSTKEFAAEHAGDSGKLGKEARLAQTLMGMSKRKKMYDHPRSKK